MGTGAEVLIPTLIAAAGTTAQYITARNAAKDQDAAAAAGIDAQGRRQREADARVNESIGAIERSGPEDEQAASLEQYLQQLRTSRGQQRGEPVPVTGGRYGEDVQTSQAAIGNYGQKVAQILSRIRAADDQRRGEQFEVGRSASDISGISRNAQGDDFLARMRYSAIRPDPWVMAAGDLAKGVGSGMATYYGSQPSAYEDLAERMARTGAEPVGVGGFNPAGGAGPWAGRVPLPNQRYG